MSATLTRHSAMTVLNTTATMSTYRLTCPAASSLPVSLYTGLRCLAESLSYLSEMKNPTPSRPHQSTRSCRLVSSSWSSSTRRKGSTLARGTSAKMSHMRGLPFSVVGPTRLDIAKGTLIGPLATPAGVPSSRRCLRRQSARMRSTASHPCGCSRHILSVAAHDCTCVGIGFAATRVAAGATGASASLTSASDLAHTTSATVATSHPAARAGARK
mmetsp:Transcript_1938/g.6777  ORF Transcript_1938/g.6777 Transcript_1938/m.6777 type:complete len:215 (+) Transcript_1938:88-732(+)